MENNQKFIFSILALFFLPTVISLSKENLYPYTGPGSQYLQTDSNGQFVSIEVQLKTPISFYDKIYNNIFVNGNGVLSFIRSMQRFFNIAFPLDDPVIAPLYTHVDAKGSGTVFYSETNDPEIISRARGMIRNSYKNITDFIPSHVFIVTWLDVGYFDAKNDKVNTYQVAISSNGTHSFVEFLYPNGGIQWIQGESHPNGLPDAKAQVGFMSEGKMYTLKGSGTDQIQNIDKWSNINRPGQWVFKVGPILEGGNIKPPKNNDMGNDLFSDEKKNDETCTTGATTCHSKAICVNYDNGYCCQCKQGYFGNGKSCQPNDLPIRVIGRVSGKINGEEFPSKDLQCYVQTKDGRTYTAISRVPESIGQDFQLLSTLGGVIGWLFAKPIGNTKNGYQLTGGLFNHSAELVFGNTGGRVTIKSTYLGLDVFGQLKMNADIQGNLPRLPTDAKIDYGDHDEIYTYSQRGNIRSHSNRKYKLNNEATEHSFTVDQTIIYQDCINDNTINQDNTTKLKYSRGLTTYETRDGIIRFAMNTKMAPLEEIDPCIQGSTTCMEHSSCIVDGDDFRCICNPGYQELYEEDGSLNCIDIDECTAGYHVCSQDAQCINNEGGHTCQCLPGFTGDGRVCEPFGTCEETRCREYEQCIMVNDQPTCTCLPGFVNTESGCYAVEENCNVANICSPNGNCTFDQSRRNYICICSPGFIGDGYTCYPKEIKRNTTITTVTSATTATTAAPTATTEVAPEPTCIMGVCWCPGKWKHRDSKCVQTDKEIATPTTTTTTTKSPTNDISCNVVNTCHPYAQCVFIRDTDNYECQCSKGYEGDGLECAKKDVSCLEANTCDPNASCHPDGSITRCVCNPGYEGDGITCSPIDECSDDSECDTNGRCFYNPTKSRYECSCKPKYTMIQGHCMPIADCSKNPSQCHANAQCITTSGDGGHKCVCMNGLLGDGINQCVEATAGCNIANNCGSNSRCEYNHTTTKYGCICADGYYGDGFTCTAKISCRQNPGLCSRDATCTKINDNHYSCVCNFGFIGDGVQCRTKPKHLSNFLLVNQGMATLRIPFFPTIANPGMPINLAYSQMTIAIDIDCANGKTYSSDITGSRITKMSYNGSDAETFITNVGSPEGISVDWVSRNIFWVDPSRSTIEVANLETKKRKVLISDGLTNPRGIAVHPYRGKIFWSDWNRANPRLEWANEDGSGREIFLRGASVKLPNSLAIDWASDELCWADAGTFTISCTPIDHKNVHVIAKELSYPFGLAISSDNYYWTDWKSKNIEVMAKSSGKRLKELTIPPGGSGKLYGIVAVPEQCPRLSNVCQYDNGRCHKDQLCLPDGQGGRTCACPDNNPGPCTESRNSS